jgi:hypothetical protein
VAVEDTRDGANGNVRGKSDIANGRATAHLRPRRQGLPCCSGPCRRTGRPVAGHVRGSS